MKLHLYVLYFLKTTIAECPPDEIMDHCKSPCHPTCQNRIPSRCYFYTCFPGCVCKHGLIRDELTGKCVDPNLCPISCPKNEIINALNVCEPSCPTKEKDYSYLVEIKNCICKSGLVRDTATNTCIPLDKCPNICNENEVLSNCTNTACRKICQNKNKNDSCSSVCEVGCVCKDNYLWDDYQKKCVRNDECISECKENEEYKECSDKLCKITCENIGQPIICPKICIPGCSCKANYVYDKTQNKCVHKNYCSKDCKINEEWSNCINSCQGTCHYPGNQFCKLECKSGCTCKKGFLWDKYKKQCVRQWECSKICGKNQVWCDYIPGDLPTCQSFHKPIVRNWYRLTFVALKPGCICKSNFILDDYTGDCIDFNDCLSGNYSSSSTKPDTSSTTSTTFTSTTRRNQYTSNTPITITSDSTRTTNTKTQKYTTVRNAPTTTGKIVTQ